MIVQHLQSELKRRIVEEGISRIYKCLDVLEDDDIWYQPNSNITPIGNTILHLNGNVRQWLVATFTNVQDQRTRAKEFEPSARCPKNELIIILKKLEQDCIKTMPYLTESTLLKKHSVQCYHEHGTSIIIHVIEHFSYHVGQITMITKLLKNIDTGYYSNDSLEDNSNNINPG